MSGTDYDPGSKLPIHPNVETLPSAQDLEQDSDAAVRFFEDQAELFTDFAKGLGVTFKPGDGWAVYPETGDATYDPRFFTDEGYTLQQSLFAVFHEIDHVKEMRALLSTKEGVALHTEKKQKLSKERIHVLMNCLKDVADNRRVMSWAPALRPAVSQLYIEKLFPSNDLTTYPKHLQFCYAILRRAMLPKQTTVVAPEVEAAIAELQTVKGPKGKIFDVLAQITDQAVDLGRKYKLLERFIEPVFEKLFEEDKQNNKNKKKGQSTDQSTVDHEADHADVEEGENEGEGQFQTDYDEFNQKMPSPLSEKEIEEIAKPGNKTEKTAEQRQAEGYQAEHGVKYEDILEYRTEYKQVEPEVEAMRAQFRRIISQRLISERRLVGYKNEGVMISPNLLAVAANEFDRGIVDPPVFLDFEGEDRTEEVPEVFEFTGVFDRSLSMNEGDKINEQRRAAILLLEALAEFMSEPEVVDNQLDPVLVASSEIRSLGGATENVVIKPLSPELSEKQRVEVFKVLSNCPGGDTQDYVVLGQIVEEMKQRELKEPGYLAKIKTRKIKKLIAIFSDGASGNESEYTRQQKILEGMGIAIVSYRRITSGQNFTKQMVEILREALDDLCYKKEI